MAGEFPKSSVKGTVAACTVEPAFLGVDQVAVLLGCSPRTVYRLADRGAMPPAIKLGALRRWRRVEIERWLDARCPEIGEP